MNKKVNLNEFLDKLNEEEQKISGTKATYTQAGVKQAGWQEIIPDNMAKIYNKWRATPSNKGKSIKDFLQIVAALIWKKQLINMLVPSEEKTEEE